MKIALTHLYLATASGDPRMILSIAQTLRKQGHSVKVYCAESDDRYLPQLREGLDIQVVQPSAPLNSVRGASGVVGKTIERIRRNSLHADAARRIERALDVDFDYVICENDYSYQVGIFYKKRNPNARIIWIMNNPPFYHSQKENFFINLASKAAAFWEALVAKRFAWGIDWAVVYSKKFKKSAELLGFKVKIIGNPLDFHYFYNPVKTVDRDNVVQILAVGSLSPHRRYEDAIDAVALLKEEGYRVRLVIVCKDIWADDIYRRDFKEYIKLSGAADYIETHFEGVEEKDMLHLLHKSHISVAPNNASVWIATSCEAMAAGMPAIISRSTAMTDALKDGKEVLFFDVFHSEQIANHIKKLIDDPKYFANIALSGQQFVKEKLDFKNFVNIALELPWA